MRRRALLCALVLLGAACGGEAEPIEVTGTINGWVSEPYKEISGPIVWGSGESGSVLREQTYTGAWATSDERLSGDDVTVVNCDISEPQTAEEEYVGHCWGTTTLTNDRGTWEGTFEGTSSWTRTEPQHVHDMEIVLSGTGEYEGFQFVGTYTGVNPPWELTGTIEPVES